MGYFDRVKKKKIASAPLRKRGTKAKPKFKFAHKVGEPPKPRSGTKRATATIFKKKAPPKPRAGIKYKSKATKKKK